MSTAEQLLRDALDETGSFLLLGRDEAIRLIASEGIRLSAASTEPGFPMVVRASRDRIALELGIDASLEARAADARIVGVIQALLMGMV
tara:strand:+ start:1915 stop:2181 length:267 start_codon:yes stop_codon:yes gene_type:complete